MKNDIREIIDFVAIQTVKTIRRPGRLILIPYYILARLVLLPLSSIALDLVLRLNFPIGWLPKKVVAYAATYYFLRGERALNENNPEESWRAFKQCVEHSDNYLQLKIAAVGLYVGLGRMREALELFRRSNCIRLSQKASLKASRYDKYCVFDEFWALHIGHASQIDYMVKLLMLERRNPDDTIFYVPHLRRVANRFLVEQWRPHLRLITNPGELPFPEEFTQFLAVDFYVPGFADQGRYYLWNVAAETYQRWAAEGRGPLLQLAGDLRERGQEALASVGVPADAWFVGLHVREPHYQRHHRGLHDVLNGQIADYVPAIDEIVRRGGWVIRMGDPSMTPLPPLPNVLDYCHSAIRSDWMDVFLAATSRFFIGTSSGVCYVAQNYGVPCVLTNWWPPAQRPWHAGDIFVPKLLRRVSDGRALPLEESLDEPFGYCNSESYLREKRGFVVEDNDPQDIRAAIIEMFERLDGRFRCDESDLAMRAQADKIYATVARRLYNSPGAFGAGVLARDFLRRNRPFVGL